MTTTPDTVTKMDDIPAFIELIRAQGAAEAQQLLDEARNAAQRLHSQAENEANNIRAEAVKEGRERGVRTRAKLLAETEASVHRDLLWARERLLQEVLQLAERRLLGFPNLPAAADVLRQLIRDALAALPSGRVTLTIPQDYLRLLDPQSIAALGGERWQIEVSTANAPAGGGVIASSADERLRFDNSFKERLRRIEDAARLAAHATLLGDGRDG